MPGERVGCRRGDRGVDLVGAAGSEHDSADLAMRQAEPQRRGGQIEAVAPRPTLGPRHGAGHRLGGLELFPAPPEHPAGQRLAYQQPELSPLDLFEARERALVQQAEGDLEQVDVGPLFDRGESLGEVRGRQAEDELPAPPASTSA